MNDESKLLLEELWPSVLNDMRPDFVERVKNAKDSRSLRMAACRFAHLALAECDTPDPRALRGVEIALMYCNGKSTSEELRIAALDAEHAAREAIDFAYTLPADSCDTKERICRVKADAHARACTAALATTLEKDIAALAWAASEAVFAFSTRSLIAEIEAIESIAEEIH